MNPPILSGLAKSILLARISLSVAFKMILAYPNLKALRKTKQEVRLLRDHYSQRTKINKVARVNKKVFISPNLQSWPSNHFHRNFLNIAKKHSGQSVELAEDIRLVLLAITKSCQMNCEHCYEAGNLNKQESLSLDDLKNVLRKLQDYSIPHFQLGGGEPMMRFDDLIALLNSADKSISDFWITTSGMSLNEEKALQLKKAGLTGVAVSLDHFDKEKHNAFRRHKNAFDWAKEAIESANRVGLATSLNICVTKEFCSPDNLMQFAELAKNWGVAFIQILEARKAGNYADKDVELSADQHKIVEEFYFKLNQKKEFKKYPIAHYYSFRQRTSGCTAAGMRYLYVDTDGYVNTCPFCRGKGDHVLQADLNVSIQKLREQGCIKYKLGK